MSKNINLLFAATSDYIKYVNVTLMSVIENLEPDVQVNVFFLYADIVSEIDSSVRTKWFESFEYSLKSYKVKFYKYDVSEYINLFYGQSIGMWGESVSYTHYMYLLAPIILKDIDKVLYLDCDICVNCNLMPIYQEYMGNTLITMSEPRGFEEMGDDVSNSGFSIINLEQWRKENTLNTILEFGKTIHNTRFCDQYLLHNYFKLNNPERLKLVDFRYNIFPDCFPQLAIEDIKILHYTGYQSKPWLDFECKYRGSGIWWQYARRTVFYESFISDFCNQQIKLHTQQMIDLNNQQIESETNNIIELNRQLLESNNQHIINLASNIFVKKNQLTFFQKIFSIKNSYNHKILTILGIKIKFRRN